MQRNSIFNWELNSYTFHIDMYLITYGDTDLSVRVPILCYHIGQHIYL